ncbi:GHKL domain-containing protein [Lutibacter sp. B2]|nr:GHKL domain-containing protein [Lutibacter sp. B2]
MKMNSIKIYRRAIIYNAIQIILITLLINNNFMKELNYFQPADRDAFELILGMIIFIINFCVIFVIKGLYIASKEEEEKNINLLRYQHIEEQKQLYIRQKHDMKNHLMVISELAKEKEYSRLDKYLVAYEKEVDQSFMLVDTGCKELDILFYTKIKKAKQLYMDVNFKCSTRIKCSNKRILDLISISSNILDNALEACEIIDDDNKKEISIEIYDDVVDHILIVKNTFNKMQEINKEKIFKEGFSTKGSNARGQGLYIVKKKVSKLNGKFHVDIIDQYFQIKIEIPKYMME